VVAHLSSPFDRRHGAGAADGGSPDGGTCGHHGCFRPGRERPTTPATVVTYLRTVVAAIVLLLAAVHHSGEWLLAGLAIYWVGDVADGFIARTTDTETRWGAVMDIVSDRLCCACYYFGLAWLDPHLWPAVALFAVNFMLVDAFLSLAFLAWPLISPNYFYLVDRLIWRWNWSKPAKAVNSALVAILLEVTRNVWLGVAIAAVLLTVKIVSLVRLGRIGLPVPGDGQPACAGATA
jgi:CDP-diacylglycerol---glycerol-3-phosphate 3-phosphatidyltransferase